MLEAVRAALVDTLKTPDARVCVALSGGVDSVVLLDLLTRLRDDLCFELSAAHVSHGISAHSAEWALFCARLCERLDVPLSVFEVSVARDDPDGLEAAARKMRHAALNSLSVDWLVFGHHADDQAETMLFRLARGAGVRGLAAMRGTVPAQDGKPGRVRPMLGLRRADILVYAQHQKLQWVEDDSNTDVRFARNFLRCRVLPVLEQGVAGAVGNMARAAGNLAEADGLLEDLAELDRQQCSPDAHGGLTLQALLSLPDARVLNVLRSGMRQLNLQSPSRKRLLELVRQLRQGVSRPLRSVLGEVACCVYRGRIWLEPAVDAPPPASLVLNPEPGCVRWGAGAVRLESTVGAGVSLARLQAATSVSLTTRWEGMGLRVGPGRPRRMFRKLCQDLGVPPWWRDRLPVLCLDGQVAWVGEIGVAGGFECAPDEPGVVLSWQRQSGDASGA